MRWPIFIEPEFDGKESIISQADHPPHPVLASFELVNLSAFDV